MQVQRGGEQRPTQPLSIGKWLAFRQGRGQAEKAYRDVRRGEFWRTPVAAEDRLTRHAKVLGGRAVAMVWNTGRAPRAPQKAKNGHHLDAVDDLDVTCVAPPTLVAERPHNKLDLSVAPRAPFRRAKLVHADGPVLRHGREDVSVPTAVPMVQMLLDAQVR